MGFFKLQRGVNAMQIEAGDCWWAPPPRRSRPPPACMPACCLQALQQLPSCCFVIVRARLKRCAARAVPPGRYAVPTWQDEQDIRSGKKVGPLTRLPSHRASGAHL